MKEKIYAIPYYGHQEKVIHPGRDGSRLATDFKGFDLISFADKWANLTSDSKDMFRSELTGYWKSQFRERGDNEEFAAKKAEALLRICEGFLTSLAAFGEGDKSPAPGLLERLFSKK